MGRAIRIIRSILMVMVALGFIYLLFLLYPQPFFRHHFQEKNITVYTGEVTPPGFDTVLDEVQVLLARSELNDSRFQHKVFIAPNLTLFGFLTRGRRNLAGLCDDRISRNIFIRPVNFQTLHIITPSDWPSALSDDRPLSYFLAHEITHSLESHFTGRWNLRIPVWLWEGYAEYIGRGPCDLAPLVDLYKRDSPVMRPGSASYDRYLLYVVYLIDCKHFDIQHLLLHPPSQEFVEKGLRTLVIP